LSLHLFIHFGRWFLQRIPSYKNKTFNYAYHTGRTLKFPEKRRFESGFAWLPQAAYSAGSPTYN
jgi:hypothetical protein